MSSSVEEIYDNAFVGRFNLEDVKILNNNENQYISYTKILNIFNNSSFDDKFVESYCNNRYVFCGVKRKIFMDV